MIDLNKTLELAKAATQKPWEIKDHQHYGAFKVLHGPAFGPMSVVMHATDISTAEFMERRRDLDHIENADPRTVATMAEVIKELVGALEDACLLEGYRNVQPWDALTSVKSKIKVGNEKI